MAVSGPADTVDTPQVSSEEWRDAMGQFPSGVTVVTSWDGEDAVGSTVSSFCSVALEPPLLLVCINKENPLSAPVAKAGVFGVHILAESGGDLAMRFATAPDEERFEDLDYGGLEGGAPHIAGAPVFIDCIVENRHAAGTHDIIIGRGVRILKGDEASPLVYYRGGFIKAAAS